MSYLTLQKGAAPATPAAGKSTLYIDASGVPHAIDSTGMDSVLAPTARTNMIRNSGFWFAQRQSPATLTTYNASAVRQVSADGWNQESNSATQYQRGLNEPAAAGLQSRYFGAFTKITSTAKIVVAQIIEQVNSEDVRGRTIRFQFWAKSVSGTQVFRLGLINSALADTAIPTALYTAENIAGVDPTLAANLSYIAPKAVTGDNGTVAGNALTFTVTGAWQRFGAVFDVPSPAANFVLIPALWSNDVVAVANGIQLAQVSLTDGFEIQAWSPLGIQAELARVQRCYCKSFTVDNQPLQNVSGPAVRGHVSVAGAVAAQPIGVRFPVEMRVPPVVTFFNPAAANAFVRNTTAGSDATATAASGAPLSTSGMDITFTGIAAWTVAQAVAVHYTADAEP